MYIVQIHWYIYNTLQPCMYTGCSIGWHFLTTTENTIVQIFRCLDKDSKLFKQNWMYLTLLSYKYWEHFISCLPQGSSCDKPVIYSLKSSSSHHTSTVFTELIPPITNDCFTRTCDQVCDTHMLSLHFN